MTAPTNTTAFERILDALRANGRDAKGDHGVAKAQCPAHDDTSPSLSIGPRRDGKGTVVKCHAGCETAAVVATLGLTMGDLFDEPKVRSIFGQRRDYRYPGGRVVHRKPGKDFPQSGDMADRSLFGADTITTDTATVYVVEGEKDVEAIQSAGGVGVCSPMGAGKAHRADWTPLAGKDVIVVADRDEPGRKHAADIVGLLAEIAASVAVVKAATGKDFADHFAAGHGLDDLVPMVIDGAELLDDIEAHFRRYICVTDDIDLALLAIWTTHTHLPAELRTTPRLQLDSTVPESGKTTVLDHLTRLCYRAILIASPPSPALIPRLIEHEIRTIALDEVDRVLRPDGPATPDLLSIINSGYRVGATRPVLVPVKGGGWEAQEMSTYSPVVLSGNAPMLPDDTRSRIIRILLMPDYDNTTEDSDWEFIEADTQALHDRIAAFADSVRDQVSGMLVDLPDGCVRRSKEKWRPLKRVAVVAGGRWPELVDKLILRSLAEERAEREAGLRALPPGMVLLTDLYAVWTDSDNDLTATDDLVNRLIRHNPDYWGPMSPYGKSLTATRFGKLLAQAAKVTSQRPGGRGPRGYFRAQLVPVWSRLRVEHPPGTPGAVGYAGYPGAPDPDLHRVNRDNRLHRVETDPPLNLVHNPVHTDSETGENQCSKCGESLLRPESIEIGLCSECQLRGDQQEALPACSKCWHPTPRTDTGLCDFCSARARKEVVAEKLNTLTPQIERTS